MTECMTLEEFKKLVRPGDSVMCRDGIDGQIKTVLSGRDSGLVFFIDEVSPALIRIESAFVESKDGDIKLSLDKEAIFNTVYDASEKNEWCDRLLKIGIKAFKAEGIEQIGVDGNRTQTGHVVNAWVDGKRQWLTQPQVEELLNRHQ